MAGTIRTSWIRGRGVRREEIRAPRWRRWIPPTAGAMATAFSVLARRRAGVWRRAFRHRVPADCELRESALRARVGQAGGAATAGGPRWRLPRRRIRSRRLRPRRYVDPAVEPSIRWTWPGWTVFRARLLPRGMGGGRQTRTRCGRSRCGTKDRYLPECAPGIAWRPPRAMAEAHTIYPLGGERDAGAGNYTLQWDGEEGQPGQAGPRESTRSTSKPPASTAGTTCCTRRSTSTGRRRSGIFRGNRDLRGGARLPQTSPWPAAGRGGARASQSGVEAKAGLDIALAAHLPFDGELRGAAVLRGHGHHAEPSAGSTGAADQRADEGQRCSTLDGERRCDKLRDGGVPAQRTHRHSPARLDDFRIDESQCAGIVQGPGLRGRRSLDRLTRQIRHDGDPGGIRGDDNDLHKGRDTGKTWAKVIDLCDF